MLVYVTFLSIGIQKCDWAVGLCYGLASLEDSTIPKLNFIWAWRKNLTSVKVQVGRMLD